MESYMLLNQSKRKTENKGKKNQMEQIEYNSQHGRS